MLSNKIKTLWFMILAGIVTYNPDLERLKDNINAILSEVDWQ